MAFKCFRPVKTAARDDGGVSILCHILDDVHGSYHTELVLDGEALSKLPLQAVARKAAVGAKLKAHVAKVHSEWVARQATTVSDEEQSIKAALDDVYTTLD